MLLSYKNDLCKDQFIKEHVNKICNELLLSENAVNVQIEIAYLFSDKFLGNACGQFPYKKITVNRETSNETMINTAAHELRHIWQEVHDKNVFKGYIHFLDDSVKYHNQPCEVDARDFAKNYCYKAGLTVDSRLL